MAERALLDEVPRIRRARAFRLYDVTGRRFLDLWQAGGEAILGHRAARTGAALKAALRLEKVAGLRWYTVEVENFESIHNHNAYAVINRRKDA